MRLFRHVAENAAERDHVFANILAFEKHVPFVRPQHAGNDLHGGRFARAVRAQKTDNFARRNLEADILDGGNGPEASVEVLAVPAQLTLIPYVAIGI